MATSFTSTSPQKKNHHSLKIFTLLLLFLLTLFIFSRVTLEPQLSLSLYRDLKSPSSKSTEILISANPEIDDNSAATFGDDKGLGTSSTENPISSKSYLDDKNSDNFTTILDGKVAPFKAHASSKSNLDGKVDTRSTIIDASKTSFENPKSRKSDFKHKNIGKEALVDSTETSSEEYKSSKSDVGDDSSITHMKKEGSVSDIYSSKNLTLWKSCDFYRGTWVKDEVYPIYRPGSCPYVDEAFDCQSNGRPDSAYLKWRWKPDGCDLPRPITAL